MRLWLKIVIGLGCVLLLVVGLGWFSLTEPDRKISKNPIMKEISNAGQPWETRVSLVGSVFESGLSKTSFETKLTNFGFSLDRDFRFYHADDVVEPDDFIWSAIQGSLVCNMEWSVIAQFDENENLISADGIVSERGCL